LLDELGAGTDPVEGSAIALGILDVFLERGAKLLVSSHMTPLKLYAYQKKELENASVIFNVDDLRPTFQLVVGLAGSSNALIISERLGLSNIIIERARSFLDKDVQRIDEVLNLLHRQKNRDGGAEQPDTASPGNFGKTTDVLREAARRDQAEEIRGLPQGDRVDGRGVARNKALHANEGGRIP